MNTKITNISKELEKEFGKHGSYERNKFDEEAYAFYTGKILHDARKSAKLTQVELAEKIGSDKAYISRIEKGIITPSVATYYRILNILGFNIELRPIA